MNQNVLVGLVLVAVVGIGGLLYRGSAITVNSPVSVEAPTPSYGSVVGPSVDSSVISIGGVETAYVLQGFTATSSTVCSIPNPFSATSSVKSIGVSRSDTGIGGTQTFYVSTTTSTGRYGSSTPAFIADKQQGGADFAFLWEGIQASSTVGTDVLAYYGNGGAGTDGDSVAILGPSEVITVRIATSSPGTFSTYMTGKCTAEIQRL